MQKKILLNELNSQSWGTPPSSGPHQLLSPSIFQGETSPFYKTQEGITCIVFCVGGAPWSPYCSVEFRVGLASWSQATGHPWTRTNPHIRWLWVWILALPLTAYVNLGIYLTSLCLSFLIYKMGMRVGLL